MTNEELALMIQKTDDKKPYLEELYTKNRLLLADCAKKYTAYCDFDDLMQEAFCAMVEAAGSWDPERAGKFTTYAVMVIRGHLMRYIEDACCPVRLPAHLQTDIRRLKRISDTFYKVHGHKPSTADLAKIMRLPEDKIMKLLQGGLFLDVKSMDAPMPGTDGIELGESVQDPQDHMSAVDEAIQRQQLREVIWEIVDGLAEDQAALIHAKYEESLSCEALAERMQTTQGKVKTLEARAMRSLRTAHNKARLRPYYVPDSHIFSLSLQYSSLHYFLNTWTSGPEKAALLAEGH